jgi:hypothetical protein
MKAITFKIHALLILFFVCSFMSCSEAQDAEKLSADKVSAIEIKIGKTFITEFYENLSKGSTYEFNKENSTEMMISTFSPEMQKTAYEQIKAQLGEYENADYAEAWVMSSNPDLKILRFKGDFTGKSEKVEVRVVLDKSNKIAGFFVKPWSDMLM